MSSTASPLEARRSRIRTIRLRVAAGTAAIFVAVFGFLFGQLSSGSDPGLAGSASASSGTTTTSQTAAQDQAATTDESTDSSDSSNSSDTWSTETPAAVQTGQS